MANRFWVGGTGTWDASDTTHWAASSNGAGGASVPGSGDSATFDASSGGGTVTVNTTVTVQSITCGAFTGTLDFSANDNNVNLSVSFSGSGSGTRTINMGDGTWTLTTSSSTPWTMTTTTGLTFNANNSTIIINGTSSTPQTIAGGGLTYNDMTLASSSGAGFSFTGANTFADFIASCPVVLITGVTHTFGTLTMNGASGTSPAGFLSSSGAASTTISVASGSVAFTWAGFRGCTFTGGATFSATNSFNLGANSGITITGPSAGGGGGGGQRVIGG
jgi:hypothetical protein